MPLPFWKGEAPSPSRKALNSLPFQKNRVKKFRALPKQNTEKKKEYLSIL